MTQPQPSSRPELLAVDDATIDDAIAHADPMVLRGLLYQLTGDPEVAATNTKTMLAGYFDIIVPATDADVALLRRKGAAFLKAYRDSGAGAIDIGPQDRLATSRGLMLGRPWKARTCGITRRKWRSTLRCAPCTGSRSLIRRG